MELSKEHTATLSHLNILAKQVVEGFITGMHKSPFHGFSVEFSEHKLYNAGESTRHIDWKLFAKTEKLYTKKYEEETNLRCHIIIDNSGSMQYPQEKNTALNKLNKIGFSAVAAACLLEILKRQRDAVGLSIYSDTYEYYALEKGSERHRNMLLHTLENLLQSTKNTKATDTYRFLHEIAEKIHRRSLLFVFTDMWQTTTAKEQLFEALRHLKYNKHEVVLFHVYDKDTEISLNFDDSPKKFVDLETGDEVQLFSQEVQKEYQEAVEDYFKELKEKCLKYQIDYVPVDCKAGFDTVLTSYLVSRRKFL
ncbi:hypothetical protein GCM10011416_11810 [Polaribacter pacificus]|uniref:DUF58 domain-containing protein n=1 Tax=Polaribacter pacificus TaxID=1775173 RepID=A0A917HZ96_9FLAO|nr:DUF58 domain-containing protein [Polaribacter pacificus]GGG95783.1 hypothetical protein GCM10011416_11810 [Polaribacter pacificus]